MAERLVLADEAGEVFGVPGHDGSAYLVEVKSHLKASAALMHQLAIRHRVRAVVDVDVA